MASLRRTPRLALPRLGRDAVARPGSPPRRPRRAVTAPRPTTWSWSATTTSKGARRYQPTDSHSRAAASSPTSATTAAARATPAPASTRTRHLHRRRDRPRAAALPRPHPGRAPAPAEQAGRRWHGCATPPPPQAILRTPTCNGRRNSGHQLWDVTDPARPQKASTVLLGLDLHPQELVGMRHRHRLPGLRGDLRPLVALGLAHVAHDQDLRPRRSDEARVHPRLRARRPAAGLDRADSRAHGAHGPIVARASACTSRYGTSTEGLLQIVDRQKLLTGPKEPTAANLNAPEISRLYMSPNWGGHTAFPVLGMPSPTGRPTPRAACATSSCSFPSDRPTSAASPVTPRSWSTSPPRRDPSRSPRSWSRRPRATFAARRPLWPALEQRVVRADLLPQAGLHRLLQRRACARWTSAIPTPRARPASTSRRRPSGPPSAA